MRRGRLGRPVYLTRPRSAATTNPAITVGYCYLYTLTGTDNVGNAASINTTVKVPFAGIDWANITTSNNRTVTCVYTTITAVTCSVTGVGNGGTFSAKVTLIDANQASVSNTTGASITVSPDDDRARLEQSGNGDDRPERVGKLDRLHTDSQQRAGKTATITASIVVNGVTYTVNCQVSS